jgi:hypothetical protein
MTYKGRPLAKTVAREFPFVVEVMIPEGVFGRRLDDMHVFHRQRGIADHHICAAATGSTITFVGALRTALPLRYSRNFPAR